jgi:hypothetical protein
LPTINEIKEEAFKFRGLLEKCDKSNTKLVIDCFPIMSCKLSSMLLSCHFLELWPELEIKGVRAATGENDQITHYWLEIDEVVIDITGDQYNLIKDSELNKAIVKNRPFEAVHVSNKNDSHLYNLFKVRESESLKYGFPTMGEEFIEDMELDYKQLLNQAACT